VGTWNDFCDGVKTYDPGKDANSDFRLNQVRLAKGFNYAVLQSALVEALGFLGVDGYGQLAGHFGKVCNRVPCIENPVFVGGKGEVNRGLRRVGGAAA